MWRVGGPGLHLEGPSKTMTLCRRLNHIYNVDWRGRALQQESNQHCSRRTHALCTYIPQHSFLKMRLSEEGNLICIQITFLNTETILPFHTLLFKWCIAAKHCLALAMHIYKHSLSPCTCMFKTHITDPLTQIIRHTLNSVSFLFTHKLFPVNPSYWSSLYYESISLNMKSIVKSHCLQNP